MKRSFRFSLSLLLLSTLFFACTEKDTQEDGASDSTTTSGGKIEEPASHDTGSGLASEEDFEEMIYSYHAHLVGQVSKAAIDKATKQVFQRVQDPEKIQGAIEQEIKKIMDAQDSVARQTIVKEYKISLDSLDAILRKKGEIHKKKSQTEKDSSSTGSR